MLPAHSQQHDRKTEGSSLHLLATELRNLSRFQCLPAFRVDLMPVQVVMTQSFLWLQVRAELAAREAEREQLELLAYPSTYTVDGGGISAVQRHKERPVRFLSSV